MLELQSLQPFSLVRISHRRWQVLDCNGIDYIGEYVTLKDAKCTTGNKYIIIK